MTDSHTLSQLVFYAAAEFNFCDKLELEVFIILVALHVADAMR